MADKFINATALLEGMPEVPYKGSVRRILMQAPAADVQPVRHGRWVDTDNYYMRWKCSECGNHTRDARPPYCPNCGALMDKEDTNVKATD